MTHSAGRRGLCATALSSGVVSLGLLLGAATATAAPAAPAVGEPAPAPAVGGPAQAPDAPPVPVVQEPVDTTDGAFGIERGSLPALGTPDMQVVPVVNQLPGLEVVALPSSTAASSPSPDEADVPATSGDTPRDSAMAGLDAATLLADLMAADPG